MLWRVTAVAVIAANTYLTLSDAVVRWLQRKDSEPSDAWLPQWMIDLIQARPDLGDAEVHAVMWGIASLIVVLALRQRPRIYIAAAAVWIWSVIVEILQPVVTSLRGFQWGDVLGNTLGVALGLMIGMWILDRRQRRRVNAHRSSTAHVAHSVSEPDHNGPGDAA
jgi:lysylphosphatidylglycerol synthetase-like protein (DUF2156 family)